MLALVAKCRASLSVSWTPGRLSGSRRPRFRASGPDAGHLCTPYSHEVYHLAQALVFKDQEEQRHIIAKILVLCPWDSGGEAAGAAVLVDGSEEAAQGCTDGVLVLLCLLLSRHCEK